MKITKIDVMLLEGEGNPSWRPIVCRIYTDEGIYGDGEAAIAYAVGAPAAYGMVKDLGKMIIGMDPLDNEVIWDIMYRNTFWGQNGGAIVFSGISALDIALWDIKAKYFGVPLYKLLGGKKRSKLRTYASQLQFGWSDHYEIAAKTEDYVANAKKAVAEGYDAIKIDFFMFNKDGERFQNDLESVTLLKPYYVNLIEERLSAVREAIGPDVDIIMENHSFLDTNSAIQLGLIAQKYKIFFFEEPNTPTPKTTKFICDKLQMPIAHGERIYSRWEFAPYFENQSVQLIQPDIGNCGGVTEAKKICDMAHVYDISVQAHVCASPISTAVALHLEAVIPNFCIHEHHVFNLHQYNKNFGKYDLQPVNGYFNVPETPGIGNELSDLCFEQYIEKTTIK
ncbi:Mandelate racemase/muconate lactonizing protein [Ruminiclostridium papyrosolvens DSM 2782]|uniref:Mandelate racemase/muconate lactonizing protein n=1 Tax=Ruminiclostridium papyrosolvens DSM 2782 TaxID=588581 RepID=F1T998_9FIRM|nr:mandelate racemase/muconate lactonizing enzyme family protein [Ruminiclostridium papyrosolvens]EGD49080.1 Mandelate racemase/muconate lactonizing protein [Ruminiclostridium papyrosolvens DSM 2782]WES35560.1 mandelate racemase/muconate lactonizing enzyme family protein [Ruminiclostridium papyrosolvens DSM 2782]